MPTDREIINAILEGDNRARTEFIKKYSSVFRAIIRKLVFNREDLIDDLMQEAFEGLFDRGYRKLRAYRGNSTVKTYLCKVVSNIVRDRLRSPLYRQLRAIEDIDDPNDPEYTAPEFHMFHEPDQQAAVLASEFKKAVGLCLGILSLRDRNLLSFRYFRDKEPKEIAEILGTTANSVSVGISKASMRMKDCINTRFPGLFRQPELESHDMF
ncbi:RNA polymerase sigma factor [Pseudomonadota bacterium]